MVGRRVYGADNREWFVGRRWLPWKPRRRRGSADALDVADGMHVGIDISDGPVSIILGILVVGVVILLFPVIITALEVVLVLVLLPLFVVARLILRKPWIIVARTKGPHPEERTAVVSGWRASREAMEAMIQDIRSNG